MVYSEKPNGCKRKGQCYEQAVGVLAGDGYDMDDIPFVEALEPPDEERTEAMSKRVHKVEVWARVINPKDVMHFPEGKPQAGQELIVKYGLWRSQVFDEENPFEITIRALPRKKGKVKR